MSWVNLLDIVYPIGAVYFSRNSTSPASIVGGSWTQIQGAVLGAIGESISNGYGGDKTISIDQMPKHKHSVKWSKDPNDEKAVEFNNQDYPSRHFDHGQVARWTSYVENSKVSSEGLVVLPTGGARIYALPLWSLYLVQNCLVGGCNG